MSFWDKFKEIKKEKLSPKQILQEYGLIVLGTFIMAIGYVVFVSPLKLAPGGVYGIAIILHHLFNFPIGLSGICLDLPLLLIGTLWLGPKFGLKTVVGIVSLSGSISVLEYFYGYDPLIGLASNPSIPDPAANFIIALCGGVCVESCVVLLALAVFKDWTIPLYSWLIIYVSGYVVDKVIAGFKSGKAVLIISDHYDEIRDRIFSDLDRGGTFLHGEGMYNNAEKKIIFLSISRKELPQLIYFVHEIDPKAFLSILEASETLGYGFQSLREQALSR